MSNNKVKLYDTMISLEKISKYTVALGRIVVIIINNIYCIPTYVLWMIMLTPLKCINSKFYYKIEGLLFHWLLAVVAMWSDSAGYKILETGDDISSCRGKRTLVIANHQSTADVPLLMACFNAKDDVLPNIMWIMDKLFKYTNFGVVSMIHGDFFIASGKNNRDASINALKSHIKCSYLETDKKWIVLFPEGGFLRKRKEVSKSYAIKNNLPVLEYVTIPRVGAFQSIIDALQCTNEKLCNIAQPKLCGVTPSIKDSQKLLVEYILDITIAYPDGDPLNLSDIVHRFRNPCTTHLYYRLYEARTIPRDEDGLKDWLYDRFVEKNALLEHFYKTGKFSARESLHRKHLIQQDVLRFLLINIFFIISTYFHLRLMCKIYAQCAYYFNHLIS